MFSGAGGTSLQKTMLTLKSQVVTSGTVHHDRARKSGVGKASATFWRLFELGRLFLLLILSCLVIDSATRVAASTWVRRPCTTPLQFSSLIIHLANPAQ